MIKTELLNDGTLIKHYSDEGKLLIQNETGHKYSDPIDVVPCRFTYTESDELIEKDEELLEPSGIPEDVDTDDTENLPTDELESNDIS